MIERLWTSGRDASRRWRVLGLLAAGVTMGARLQADVVLLDEVWTAEIVQNEVNGYLVDDEEAMAAVIADLDKIDPATCRESVATRFSPDTVAASYVEIYRQAAAAHSRSTIAAV